MCSGPARVVKGGTRRYEWGLSCCGAGTGVGRGFLTGAFWGIIVGGVILFTAALVLESRRISQPAEPLDLAVWDTDGALRAAFAPDAEILFRSAANPQSVTRSDRPTVAQASVAAQARVELPGSVPPAESLALPQDGGARAIAGLTGLPERAAPDAMALIKGAVPEPVKRGTAAGGIAAAPNAPDPRVALTAPQSGLGAIKAHKVADLALAPEPDFQLPARVAAAGVTLQRGQPPKPGQAQASARLPVLAVQPVPELPEPEVVEVPLRVAFVALNATGPLPAWMQSAVLPWGSPIFPRRDSAEWVRLISDRDVRSAPSAMPMISDKPVRAAGVVPAYRILQTAGDAQASRLDALAERARRDGYAAVLVNGDPAILSGIESWLARAGTDLTPVPLSELLP